MNEPKQYHSSHFDHSYPDYERNYYAPSGSSTAGYGPTYNYMTRDEPPRYSTNFFSTISQPPRYSNAVRPLPSYSPWHPRNWSNRTRIAVAIGTVVLLILIVVPAAVVGSKSSQYPDYAPLRYKLKDTYIGRSFFDNFNYFVDYDPAEGFVHYSNQDQCSPAEMNLTFASENSAVLRVDNTQTNAYTGRHSARVFSKNTYNDGLFIFDVIHTPYGCASWPAVWLVDQSHWPRHGEIDVIEAVNQAKNGNQMTLHTTNGCTMESTVRKQKGEALQSDCYNATHGNAGCGVRADPHTFGEQLNKAGGGVYAMELRSAGIRIWFFPRSDVPEDITKLRHPQPDKWGEANADFPSTNCNITQHFRNLSITIDIDVCGQWAGKTSVYDKSDCPGECTHFAASHPQAFDQSYWEFKSVQVYQAKNALGSVQFSG